MQISSSNYHALSPGRATTLTPMLRQADMRFLQMASRGTLGTSLRFNRAIS